MDYLNLSLEQNPVFGNASSGGNAFILKSQYAFLKFYYWLGDAFPLIFNGTTWEIVKGIFSIFTIFCLVVIIYCSVRMFEIRAKEHAHMHHEIEEYAHNRAIQEKEKRRREELSTNPHWVNIINYLASPDSAQWKMAIIEADGMLDDLMDQLGFQGESLGEKLKSADQKKFKSLPLAWEAHTIRNRIAHEGSNFILTSREAKRVVAIYEQIFREYGFI